jgi:hypothetical protein
MIGIPTRDEYMLGRTLLAISSTAAELHRQAYFDFGFGSNICTGRDSILKVAKDVMGGDSGRILWLDSDVMISTPPNELARYLKEAEEKGYNIASPYRRTDQYSSIGKAEGGLLKWDDLGKLEQYDKISWAGLGFYYGYTPFNYKFYMSGDVSEDYHFFMDNKIELRVDKRITLYHSKRVYV